MLKRTTGRLLLSLLVTTGLAGTLNTSSLTPKERKQAIGLIKDSRKDIFSSIDGLSARQLKYRPGPQEASIKDLILLMAWKEQKCSGDIKNLMTNPSNPESRLQIALTDEQLLSNDDYRFCTVEQGKAESSGKEPVEAIQRFASLQNDHIQYIRTSTEDLRNHVMRTSAGWIDCYQYFLLLADQNKYFAEKINKIRSSPHFPRK